MSTEHTDRRSAERDALRRDAREAYHHAVWAVAMHDGTVFIGSNDQIVFADIGAAALFGYGVEKLVGQNVRVLLPDDEKEALSGFFDDTRAMLHVPQQNVVTRTGHRIVVDMRLSKVDDRLAAVLIDTVHSSGGDEAGETHREHDTVVISSPQPRSTVEVVLDQASNLVMHYPWRMLVLVLVLLAGFVVWTDYRPWPATPSNSASATGPRVAGPANAPVARPKKRSLSAQITLIVTPLLSRFDEIRGVSYYRRQGPVEHIWTTAAHVGGHTISEFEHQVWLHAGCVETATALACPAYLDYELDGYLEVALRPNGEVAVASPRWQVLTRAMERAVQRIEAALG